MSTKTTFKRVALVAVAALGFGMLSVAPSSAANTVLKCDVADGRATGTATFATGAECNGVAGAANTVRLSIDDAGVAGDRILVSGAGAAFVNASVPAATVVATNGLSATLVGATGYGTVDITTTTVGTVTVTLYRLSSATGTIYESTATDTVTITVGATQASGAYSAGYSKAYLAAGDTSTANATTDAAGSTKLKSLTTAAATIKVIYKDATDTGIASKVLTASASGTGGTVTGHGSWSDSGTSSVANQYTVTATTDGDGIAYFKVWANGQTGTTTVKIYNSDSVLLTTKTVTFSGTTAATHTVTTYMNYIAAGMQSGAGGTAATSVFKVVLKDSNGNVVSGITPTATAANTSLITDVTCGVSGSTGKSYCSATAAAAKNGSTVVTFKTGSSAAGTLVTSTATINVSSLAAATFTVTADSSAEIGGTITYTITAKDANGLPVADGTAVRDYLYKAPSIAGGALTDNSSTANQDDPLGIGTPNAPTDLFAGVYFDGGVATDSVQAPFGATSIVATFLNNGAGIATVGGDYFATAALRNASVVVTTSVANTGSQAAADAAAEATDAANAATDAANAAAEAADAATAAAQDAADAVAALSAQVATLISGLKSQLTALTNLVIKIQKKVKA